jgi:hypothetical protein
MHGSKRERELDEITASLRDKQQTVLTVWSIENALGQEE